MKKFLLLCLGIMLGSLLPVAAQLVVPSPRLLQESSPDVVLTLNAASPLGDRGLAGLGPDASVYAYIGAITDKSDGGWVYVPAWHTFTDKYKMTYKSSDLWQLSMGDMRKFFGITDPDEHILKLGMLFYDSTGKRECRGVGGSDIFVDVAPEGFRVGLFHGMASTVVTSPESVSVTAAASQPCQLSITVNASTVATRSGATELEANIDLKSVGSYRVEAVAEKSDGTVATSALTFLYLDKAESAVYPGGIPRQGAVDNGDGTYTFCIAAPGKTNVTLIPSWDGYAALPRNLMKYHDYNGVRYFWLTASVPASDNDKMYYYLVDGTAKVGDPYARLVHDPYDHHSEVPMAILDYPGRNGYRWIVTDFKIPDHHNLMIYEILLRDFTGQEGKSNASGTLSQAMERIPYLRDLGVNAVELMPVMEFSGSNSWGYNTNFYFAPDQTYGTPADYKEFIDRCHQAGIAVILDVVLNHSDCLHPWYAMYPDGASPFFNATAPHAYSVFNDWNQQHPLVMKQWTDMIDWWMKEYKVDGFRFDLVKGLGDNDSYTSGTDAYNASRVARMKELHVAILRNNPSGIHINENLAGPKEENEMAAGGQLNWACINAASAAFASIKSADSDLTPFYAPSHDGRSLWSTVSYIESHDEQRVGYVAANTSGLKNNKSRRMLRLGSLAAQMIMTPGPHMIWQFGELGNEQNTKTATDNDTSPKQVCWSLLDDDDRAGLHESYRTLCNIRRDNPDLFSNPSVFIMNCTASNWSAGRSMRISDGSKEIVVFINPVSSGQDKTITIPVSKLITGDAVLLSKSHGFDSPAITVSGDNASCVVPPNCYAVFGSRGVTGIDSVSEAAPGPSVTGGKGCVTIHGPYKSFTVHDMSGRRYGSLMLPPGIYIVTVDGHVTKVTVR